MPESLEWSLFSEERLAEVQQFKCGSDYAWQTAIATWIKSPADQKFSALYAIEKKGTRVWLYHNQAGQLVGYGSLGTTNWTWPYPNGARKAVSIIPSLGIQLEFQGEPKTGPKEDKFSRQIMRHLISESVQQGLDYLVLKVHEDNGRAIDLYVKKFRFRPFRVKEDRYIRMRRRVIPKAPPNLSTALTL